MWEDLYSIRKLSGVKLSESKERGKTFQCNSYLIDHLGIHAREKLDGMKVVLPLVEVQLQLKLRTHPGVYVVSVDGL